MTIDPKAPIIHDWASQLASGGTLRAAINTANPVLTYLGADGTPDGLAPDIAAELARSLGLAVELIPYGSAGHVVEAANRGEWDVAFLAVDPTRSDRIAFSRLYIAIEGTYVVPAGSSFSTCVEVDRVSVGAAAAVNSAYDLYLTRTLRHAQLLRAPDPSASLELFVTDGLDAAAGVRQALDDFAESRTGYCVLPDAFMTIEQSLAIPRGRETAIGYIDGFMAALRSSGWMRKTLDRNGQALLALCETVA
jgi:polar amino acid transport system substrate-binding protein